MGCQQSHNLSPYENKTSQHEALSELHVNTANSLHRRKRVQKKLQSIQKLYYMLQPSDQAITEEEIELLKKLLTENHPLFKNKYSKIKALINELECYSVPSNQILFTKGDPSKLFFIIRSGLVQINDFSDQNQEKVLLSNGDYFGDLGIVFKAKRSATAITRDNTQLFCLKYDKLQSILSEISKETQKQNLQVIRNLSIFQNLTSRQMSNISYCAKEQQFLVNSIIFKKGDDANCLYVIKSGKVILQVSGKMPIVLKRNQSFGQGCLKECNSIRSGTATCSTNVIVLAFAKSDIRYHLGDELKNIQMMNRLNWAISHQKLLNLPRVVIQKMISLSEIIEYDHNELILSKGDAIKHLIISLEGSINNSSQLTVFNSEYIADIKFLTANLIKKDKGKVAFIDIKRLERLLQDNLTTLISNHWAVVNQLELSFKIKQHVDALTLNQFTIFNRIGQPGYFGVTLQVRSSSKTEFALKVYQKQKIIQEEVESLILNQKYIGSTIKNQFIIKIFRVFEDEKCIHFLNQFVEGEDLFSIIKREKTLSLSSVKLYSACLIHALEYLHSRKIIFRDLKIEDCVIDKDGYLNIVDLLTIEELDEDCLRSFTRVGTPFYTAPEALEGKGYGFQADLWSLGVIIYYMLTGMYPYGHHLLKSSQEKDISSEIFSEIVKRQLIFPSNMKSETKILLKLLLNQNSIERNLLTFDRLKKCTFFDDIDWIELSHRKCKKIEFLPNQKNQKYENYELTYDQFLEAQKYRKPDSKFLKYFKEEAQ